MSRTSSTKRRVPFLTKYSKTHRACRAHAVTTTAGSQHATFHNKLMAHLVAFTPIVARLGQPLHQSADDGPLVFPTTHPGKSAQMQCEPRVSDTYGFDVDMAISCSTVPDASHASLLVASLIFASISPTFKTAFFLQTDIQIILCTPATPSPRPTHPNYPHYDPLYLQPP